MSEGNNKLSDLNNHLFDQMNRLSNASLDGKELKKEIERSKQVAGLAKQIIDNGRLVLDADIQVAGYGGRLPTASKLLGSDEVKK